jgi:hypothetical protein
MSGTVVPALPEIVPQTAKPLQPKAPKRSLADAFEQVLETNKGQTETILSNRFIQNSSISESILEEQAKKLYKKEVQAKLASLRVRPRPETANQEKMLRKIGTAGVVQFFNAVHKAQQAKDANTEKQKLMSAEKVKNKINKKGIKHLPKDEESIQSGEANFMTLIKR